MKTIKEIEVKIKNFNLEITHLISQKKEVKDRRHINKQIKILNTEVRHWKNILYYLETQPTLEYLNREKERLEKLIDSLSEKYYDWQKNNAPPDIHPNKRKTYYNKEMGVNKLKYQLKAVNQILQD